MATPAPGVNLYPFDPIRGKYLWHCHNLQYQNNEMMRLYLVWLAPRVLAS